MSPKLLSVKGTFINLPKDSKFSVTQKKKNQSLNNLYNGGGLGIGDFNNDGDLDVYLTVNEIYDRNSPFVFRPVISIYGGIHYRFSANTSAEHGNRLGEFVKKETRTKMYQIFIVYAPGYFTK